MDYIQEELERLKAKKIELATRINASTDFDEKEALKEELERIERQIEILEKMK